jgi:serine/threonine-protein kinase
MTQTEAGTCAWLANEVAVSHLVERESLDPVISTFQTNNPDADAHALAVHLVKVGLLTNFQASRLLEGEGRGLVLGPYVLTELLGQGSMGTVYKALGRADRKPYAVKVLPVHSRWNVRQARKKLQQFPVEPHPSVVPWLDVGTSAGLHYLVWPFVEGVTLPAAVERDGMLPPPWAAAIGVQIANALQWCERHQLWHGAIKPSNIMLGSDGKAKLLDFGVGVLLAGGDEQSISDTPTGTSGVAAIVDCTAPECVADPTMRSVRGDQYSLGCTLYYALTGRYPVADGAGMERIAAHQRETPPPVTALNPGVPPPLAAAIERLLRKDPVARYNHTDELIAALTPLARQSSVYLPPPAPSPGPVMLPKPGEITVTPVRATSSILAVASARLSSPGLAPPSSMSLPAIVPVTLPATPPRRLSGWERFRRRFRFWRTWAEPVACTLLAPGGLIPGREATIQVVLHHRHRAEQAKTLADWRGTQPLPDPLERGQAIGMHLGMPGVEVPKPQATIDWNGLSAATLFLVRLPEAWPSGRPVHGALTIGYDQTPVATLGFAIPVAAAQAVG